MSGARWCFLLSLLVLSACGPSAPADRAPTHGHRGPGPLAEVLAVAVCRELDGHLFPLASSTAAGPDVIDMYVLPKRCRAQASGDDDLHVVVDAYAWLAVDREVSGIRVQEFVHTTVHADVLMRTRARWADDHLEVVLTPHSKMELRVEPLGALELDPTNWASLLALELAPSAGQSPEWIAKQKLRTEAEQTLAKAVGSGPLVVSFDGKTGMVWFSEARPSPPPADALPITRVRLTPRGTSLTGAFGATPSTSTAHVVVEKGHRVFARALCSTHAERILDADRRGDAVDVADWQSLEGKADLSVPSMPCRWMLALRASPHETANVELSFPAAAVAASPMMDTTKSRAPESDRWVSIDRVVVDRDHRSVKSESVDPEEIVLGSDVWSTTIPAPAPAPAPSIVVLSPNQSLVVRALYPHDGSRRAGEILAEAHVLLDADKPAHAAVPLVAKDGRKIATVQIDTRVRKAPSPPRVNDD